MDNTSISGTLYQLQVALNQNGDFSIQATIQLPECTLPQLVSSCYPLKFLFMDVRLLFVVKAYHGRALIVKSVAKLQRFESWKEFEHEFGNLHSIHYQLMESVSEF